MSIGEDLAQARRRAGLTLAQVSQRTRIRERIIADIESDDYSACGGDFYARGHIRSIARAVGADPEPFIRRYDAVGPEPQPANDAEITQPGIGLRGQPGIPVFTEPAMPVSSETDASVSFRPGAPVAPRPGGPVSPRSGGPVSSDADTSVSFRPGRPESLEHGWPSGTEPGRPAHTEPGRPVHTEPGWPAHAEPSRPRSTEPGRLAGSAPGRLPGRETGQSARFGPGRAERTEPGWRTGTGQARPAHTEPGRPAGTGHAWAARAEPGQATRADASQAARAEPGQATRAEPGQAVRAEPGQAVRAEPGQAVRAESGFPFFTEPAAPAEGPPARPPGSHRQPPPEGPGETRRRRPLNWAALVALALLAGIGYLAYHMVAGSPGVSSSAHTARAHPATHPPAGHSGPASTPAASPSPGRKAAPPARPLTPVSARALGVSGQGDNPGNASLAIDGTPGTAWRTDWYTTARFGNLYPGTGLLVDMGRPMKITAARIAFGPGHGGRFQLRIGPRPVLPGLRPVAHGSAAGVARLRLASPARGRYVLIWLTSLPVDPAGTYRASVYDVRLRGR